MKDFKINYKWSERNNAFNRSWQTDYLFVEATSKEDARQVMDEQWTASQTDYEIINIEEL